MSGGWIGRIGSCAAECDSLPTLAYPYVTQLRDLAAVFRQKCLRARMTLSLPVTRRGVPLSYDGSDPALCNARTQHGHPCRALGIAKGGRCKWYGGMSTGPRTAEGRKQSGRNAKKATAARMKRALQQGIARRIDCAMIEATKWTQVTQN